MGGWILIFDINKRIDGDLIHLLIHAMTQRDIFSNVSYIFLSCKYDTDLTNEICRITTEIFELLLEEFPFDYQHISRYKEPFDEYIFEKISLPVIQLKYNEIQGRGDIRKRIMYISSKANAILRAKLNPFQCISVRELERAFYMLNGLPNKSPLSR
jgi:hypothetical protein